MSSHSGYLNNVFEKDKRRKALELACKALEEIEFDAFLVRGVSGTTMGSMLAAQMGKDLVVMRKRDVNSHASELIEFGGDGRRLVIVDDLYNSGDTLRGMARDMEDWTRAYGTSVNLEAIVFYNYFSCDYEEAVYTRGTVGDRGLIASLFEKLKFDS